MQIGIILQSLRSGGAAKVHQINSIENLLTENQNFLEILLKIYLTKIKRRGYVSDSVANFHLRNGALIYRINFLADTSVKGLNESLGFMVNYKYDLADIDQNSFRYQLKQEVIADDGLGLS